MKKLIFCGLLLALSSCVETVVVGTIATGTVVTREKSLSDTGRDMVIAAKIEKEFLAEGILNIEYEVEEQKVYLTGVANTEDEAAKAVKIASKVSGVKDVVDEIQISAKYSEQDRFVNYFKDAAITAQVKTRLLFQKNISSLNYEVTTVNGDAYLTGIADDDAELRKVNTMVAKTKGVKRVVSHISLAKAGNREDDDNDE